MARIQEMPRDPGLVIFDLDGTLVDSALDLATAVNLVLGEHGAAPLHPAQIRAMIGEGAIILLRRAFAARNLPIPDPEAKRQRFLAACQANPAARSCLYEGVRETLAALHDLGIPMAVCTNKAEALARIVLDDMKIGTLFSGLVGGDTHPFCKPDPRMLQGLLQGFAVEPARALMVGDSEIDAATAEAAGVPFVLVTYGYRRGPVEGMQACALVERFAELMRVIGPASRSSLKSPG
ncbi:MAG: HAD-IA family hydrolase, partial [Proteobacteria bacterium]|nr:HAD-IA family hydrolase [Pseudomonadota bacterium]